MLRLCGAPDTERSCDMELGNTQATTPLMKSEGPVPTSMCDETRESEMDYAKKMIAQSKTGAELLRNAEKFVKDDWLNNIRELPGNIYRCTAFGKHIGVHFGEWNENGLKAFARLVGFVMVWVIQVSAPPAIMISSFTTIGIEEDKAFKWKDNWQPDNFSKMTEDWRHIAMTKSLATALCLVFCLNAFYDTLDERLGWKKVDSIFCYLQRITPGVELPGQKYLLLGALTNSWLKCWCCLDSYVVIGGAKNPKDCIMDSLGLLFLFKLDDISGDVSFVSEDAWPGYELGWVYENMVEEREETEDKITGKKVPAKVPYKPAGLDLSKQPADNYFHTFVRRLHFVTVFFCGSCSIALPLLAAYTPFLSISPAD